MIGRQQGKVTEKSSGGAPSVCPVPLHPADWWRGRLRDAASTYGRASATFRLWADMSRADGFEPPVKLSGGARKHRPRPARDALFLASKRTAKDEAEWWQRQVERFMVIAEADARSLAITLQPSRRDLAAAYREWVHVVSESVIGTYIGNYRQPRLARAKRTDGRWTGKYWLLVPKDHQAARDDATRRALLIDLASELPDVNVTPRDVRKIRRRRAR